jgi:serine/threonine-protein kinase
MVTRDGTVKVMDFGIARVLGPETAPQTSAWLGTASYLSPEQAQGGPVDARTDIYSLGAVLLRDADGPAAVHGRHPRGRRLQAGQTSDAGRALAVETRTCPRGWTPS